MTTDPGDLVVDPTCGSGTTAYVAEHWGRRWISIDTSRVALALARTRLMSARFPYYLLTDSPSGRKKQAELTGVSIPPGAPPTQRDMHRGFVYRTVPHVTLKSIANNPDIREGMTREQINLAIRKHSDTETLYDQPYEDKGVVRLTGPFTVESLSPHRELPPVEGIEPSTPTAARLDPGNYLQTIFANLLKAGVKGTTKDQRIAFTRLDTYPGQYVQAEGETTTGQCVRVSVGPELGTVGDEWVKKAGLEAIKGSRCGLLLICAFSFEAGVHEQAGELGKEIQFGKLRILPVRMNPDMAMFGDQTGQELLKKTGAANLFSVFGEPDLKIEPAADGKLAVTVRGVDVFDPTTGEVRSGGTDDIACWFIDTDYNGESFFVRHAYFLYGGKDTKEGPYEKLKKALRAEVDEGEWSKLYRATSQPFPRPKSGKIAVKVINHFGDEVLKVYAVAAVPKNPPSQYRVERGKAKFYIQLLLRTWKKPLSREMLERGLVLMLNGDIRRAILNPSSTPAKRGKRPGTTPQFVRGMDTLLGEMLDDGQLKRGPEDGFFALGEPDASFDAAPPSDFEAVRETAETMKVIQKDKQRATDAEFASELNGKAYDFIS